MVEALLAAGANVEASTQAGVRPLYVASKRGHLGVVEALVVKKLLTAGLNNLEK